MLWATKTDSDYTHMYAQYDGCLQFAFSLKRIHPSNNINCFFPFVLSNCLLGVRLYVDQQKPIGSA